MAAAVPKVHQKHGFWSKDGGSEHDLLIMAATFAIAAAGGGPLSLDGLRGKRRTGTVWSLAQLAVGIGAAVGAMRLAGRWASGTNGHPDGAGAAAGEGTEQATLDLTGHEQAGERPEAAVQ